jgi:hypothetical protein
LAHSRLDVTPILVICVSQLKHTKIYVCIGIRQEIGKEKRNGKMSKRRFNFITHPIGWRSGSDRLQFAIEFCNADLSALTPNELGRLRQRLMEFLGFLKTENPEEYASGYAGVMDASGIDVDFEWRPETLEPEDYELSDFLRLQDELKRILKATAHDAIPVTSLLAQRFRVVSVSFTNISFSLFEGSLTVNAENPTDAFLVVLLLLLNRPEYAKRIWQCIYCENPFLKTKRQKYCKSCKTRADRERVKQWRRKRANRIKEGARAARRRLRMRSNK